VAERVTTRIIKSGCDLCGCLEAAFILATPRLEGDLVCCTNCKLFFVDAVVASNGNPEPLDERGRLAAASAMRHLAQRASELELVDPQVEEREGPWRRIAAKERLNDLSRFAGTGQLLEIGCSTGELLCEARERFAVTGIEADADSSCVARARGLNCIAGTIADAALTPGSFDVAVLYHVIEHLPSPHTALTELRELIRPNGLLVLETPNIETIWFSLLRERWRQLIPDHRYFFTPSTLTALCERSGFEVRELRTVGKSMSLRLFISRLGRYHRPTAAVLEKVAYKLGIGDATLRLNLGDVIRLYARRV
jgi:2-polyprenyl-3-methyl-5-hydroxy-6-metoxy-1,4-benzoquinol methylase